MAELWVLLCLYVLKNIEKKDLTTVYSKTFEGKPPDQEIYVIDRPEVRYLNKYVRDPLCAAGPNKWRDLGLILIGESNRSKLGMIKIDEKHSVSGCCDAMFALWLEIDPEPSWNKLIAALREISLKAIAKDLTKILSQN